MTISRRPARQDAFILGRLPSVLLQAGLLCGLSLSAASVYAQDTPAVMPQAVVVHADGNPNTPDGLSFTLPLAPGESIQDIRLQDLGRETSIPDYFVRQTSSAGVTLTLTPAIDFDRLATLQATLKIIISGASHEVGENGVREVILPVLITSRALDQDALADAHGGNAFAGTVTAPNPITRFAYDNNGNRIQVIDPMGVPTLYGYDALNRPSNVRDAANGQSLFTYNGLDQLIKVTDPRNLATSYFVDGLGNAEGQISPDSGLTSATYDVAGNMLTRTNAKGQITRYSYDALNRVAGMVYQDGSSVVYGYDAGLNATGHLTSITEKNAAGAVTLTTSYTYAPLGRIATDTRTIAGVAYTVAYTYSPGGQIASITYPSGRVVSYGRDAVGRISLVQLTDHGVMTVLANNITYRPTGEITSYTNGAGQVMARTYDNLGRLTSYVYGGTVINLTYDANSRIIGQQVATGRQSVLSYDALNRLTGMSFLNAPGQLPFSFSYDANGNRTQQLYGTTPTNYSIDPASNRILSRTANGSTANYAYDANGSTTVNGLIMTYDARGRISQASLGTTKVIDSVNALGQRVAKQVGAVTTAFIYDEAGQFLSEQASDGSNTRDYVRLGNLPLAIVQQAPTAGVYYVQPDHLGTPRVVTDNKKNMVWVLDPLDTFGNQNPNPSPAGGPAFNLNLRFPGQYFDPETRLVHNGFRDYYAADGRYVESDPIGLRGGINTYAYVRSNPLSGTDLWGLYETVEKCPGCGKSLEIAKQQAIAACKQAEQGKTGITDPALASSISNACKNGKIVFHGLCPPGFKGYWQQSDGSTIHICVNGPGNKSTTTLHEFAHSCGWNHGDGKGVPNDPGEKG